MVIPSNLVDVTYRNVQCITAGDGQTVRVWCVVNTESEHRCTCLAGVHLVQIEDTLPRLGSWVGRLSHGIISRGEIYPLKRGFSLRMGSTLS